MPGDHLVFSGYALERMALRGISRDEVAQVIDLGESMPHHEGRRWYQARLERGWLAVIRSTGPGAEIINTFDLPRPRRRP
jgi:hypothetical protein